jgi:hypothetical protein
VLRATHAHDLERLAEAESRLKDELAAKAARDAKAEEEAEEAAAEKALQARQLAAAITIQAAWRGFKVRMQLLLCGRMQTLGSQSGACGRSRVLGYTCFAAGMGDWET